MSLGGDGPRDEQDYGEELFRGDGLSNGSRHRCNNHRVASRFVDDCGAVHGNVGWAGCPDGVAVAGSSGKRLRAAAWLENWPSTDDAFCVSGVVVRGGQLGSGDVASGRDLLAGNVLFARAVAGGRGEMREN